MRRRHPCALSPAGSAAFLATAWYDIGAGGKSDVYLRVVGHDGAPFDLTIDEIEVNISRPRSSHDLAAGHVGTTALETSRAREHPPGRAPLFPRRFLRTEPARR